MMLFFFKQKTAYEITYGDWSSDVCSSDLVGGPWPVVIILKDGKRTIAVHCPEQITGKHGRSRFRLHPRHRVKIPLDRASGECPESRLRAEDPRRPVQFWIPMTQRAKKRPTNSFCNIGPTTVLDQIMMIAPIPCEVFISAVSRKCNCDMAPGRLRNIVCRHRRRIREW